MKFQKIEAGVYRARNERFEVRISRSANHSKVWDLEVVELAETAGVRHTLGQSPVAYETADSLREAKKVAVKFVELAANTSTYGLQRVLFQATVQVVEADIADIKASPEYQVALERLRAISGRDHAAARENAYGRSCEQWPVCPDHNHAH